MGTAGRGYLRKLIQFELKGNSAPLARKKLESL
jgi:hypothetical protein